MEYTDQLSQAGQSVSAMKAESRDSTPSAVSDDSIPKVTNDDDADDTKPVQNIRFIDAAVCTNIFF